MSFNKNELIQYRISRAHETSEDAKIALDNNRLFAAENRIYYSIFYIVSALALKDNYSTSKHGQLLGWFNKTYIKTDIISIDYGKIYADAFENRQECDYQDFIRLDPEDVQRHFKDMQKFITEIEKIIDEYTS